jgi:hypothetical protein
LTSAAAGQVGFRVDQPGKVSLAIYDTSGQMVRTLLNAKTYAAGAYSVAWDGKNDAGAALAAGSYSFKLLQTPGLRAEYLMTLQTTLPIGNAWVDRELGLGNHDGPTSVATDANGIYIGTGGAENIANALKMNWDGSQRLWSGNQPAVFMGRHSMSVMGGRLYALQQDGWLIHQGVNEPNWPWSSVGAASNGDLVGSRWDAQWPGVARSGPDDWKYPIELLAPMDMTAFDSGNNPQLVMAYRDRNMVQWRNPTTGAVLDSVSIASPTGVAIDNQGNVLIATANSLVRVSRANKTLQILASGLIEPYRLDVDRSTNEIVLAERGTSQQIKRFAANGALLATYGRSGGRLDGLYEARDFRNVTDITADGSGGFIVTERSSPRRIARFDRTGALIKEWYAGSHWSPHAAPEPGNPAAVWADGEHGEVMRLTLDYATRSWRVHSTYRVPTLDGQPYFSLGTGIGVFKPKRVNGRLYLALDGQQSGDFTVWKIDESQWRMQLSAAGSFHSDTNALYFWADANGDGTAQSGEYRRFAGSFYGYNALDLRSDANLNFYGINIDGSFVRFNVTGWNSAGAPLYGDLSSPARNAWVAMPADLLKSGGGSNTYNSSHMLSFGADNSVYGSFGIGDHGWSAVDAAMVARWDASGKLLWKRKLGVAGSYYDNAHIHSPGSQVWSTFKSNVGVVYGNVVTQDFNGGNNGYGKSGITDVWNEDGLFVGGMFDTVDTSKFPARYYNLSSENGAGAVHADTATGTVLYFGGTENANHVYRVSGWGGWLKLNGTINRP